jgi:hypothetical protein
MEENENRFGSQYDLRNVSYSCPSPVCRAMEQVEERLDVSNNHEKRG